MQSILFCVLHGQVYKYRYDKIMNTWGKNVPVLFYSDYEAENVIRVSEDTSYLSNEEKHINILNLLLSTKLEYDWYFFCDDDTFININLLSSELAKFNRQKSYGQIINCWKHDRSLRYFSGGAGWLINKEVMTRLRPVINHKTNFSDVSLGINMRDLGIPMINDSRFRSQPPKHYDISRQNIKKFITFHYIRDMQELHNICQENND